ncbi:MAG TPA: hypothetical protein VFA55_02970 [Candidatus Kapabacteria bacterium]|nr:hypothetical protein [Candidatus Kapabacteria bacterium]
MKKEEQILHELKTLSPSELEEVLTFIGYLKFRAATSQEESPRSRPLDIGDA